jgi:hypothetical protein
VNDVVDVVPPFWVNQQPPAEILQTVSGHSVELKCHVHGVPPPQVVWSFAKGIKRQIDMQISLPALVN